MAELTKRLWLRSQNTHHGIIKVWILRDYSKAVPTHVYFWDSPDWLLKGDFEE